MTNFDLGNEDYLHSVPAKKEQVILEHFISLEYSQEFQKRWEKFRDDLNKLLENVLDDKCGKDDLVPLATTLKETLLINYERFDFKSNPGFRHALIKLILDSDFLDVQFGLKLIDGKLHQHDKSGVLKGKESISCVMLTGKNYAADPKDKPSITCITIP
jgi:hypothetical protein